MKKTFLILILLAFVGSSATMAQVKLAHVDAQSILQSLPDFAKAKEDAQKKAQELQNTLAQLEAEYNEMYNKYSSEEASMSEAVKALKQDEIRDKITRIDNFRASAQEELQTEEAKLLQPVYEKVRAAIQEVAKEQGYTYVLDAATLLYVDGGTDISEDVKKKLNMAGK